MSVAIDQRLGNCMSNIQTNTIDNGPGRRNGSYIMLRYSLLLVYVFSVEDIAMVRTAKRHEGNDNNDKITISRQRRQRRCKDMNESNMTAATLALG